MVMSGGVPCVRRTIRRVTSRIICLPNDNFATKSMQSTSTLIVHAHAHYGHRLLRKDGIGFVTATAVNFSRVSISCYSRTKVM